MKVLRIFTPNIGSKRWDWMIAIGQHRHKMNRLTIPYNDNVDIVWNMREENELFLNEVRLERFFERAKHVRHFNRI